VGERHDKTNSVLASITWICEKVSVLIYKTRSDICTSIILGTKPSYNPIFVKKEISVAIRIPPSTLAHSYKTKIFELTGMYGRSEELVTFHEELRTLSYLKEKAAYSLIEGEEIDNIPFTDTDDLFRGTYNICYS
jgi:hypothetical protein